MSPTDEQKWPLLEDDEEFDDLDDNEAAAPGGAAGIVLSAFAAIPGSLTAVSGEGEQRTAESQERTGDAGDGTMFVSTEAQFDSEEVIRGLTERGHVQESQVPELRKAMQALQTSEAAHARTTLTMLATLAGGQSGVNADQAKQLVDLSILQVKYPELQCDLSRLSEAGVAGELTKTVELAKRLAVIDSLANVDKATVGRLRNAVLMQLAQPSSEARLAELNRVVEKITSADFLRRPDAKVRLGHYTELLSITNPHLRIPFDKLLNDRISTENLKFVVDRFKESGRSPFRPPVDTNPRLGTTFEYNSSRTAMDAYHSQGGGWVFIPSANGSQADKGGIDGMLVNPETGELKFLDWTKDMAGKYRGGKAEWAMSPDPAKVHDYANNNNPPNERTLKEFRLGLEAGLKGMAGGRNDFHEVPSTNIRSFEKIPVPSFAENPAETGAQATRRFIEAVGRNARRVNDSAQSRGWRYEDPVIDHMERRARNSYGNLVGEQELASRLARPIAQLAELEVRGRRPGDIGFDASRVQIHTDRTQLNEITKKPMRYIELPVNIEATSLPLPGERRPRGGTIVSVRLYEDGSIRGALEYTDREGATKRQNIELGHVSELVSQMRRDVTRGISDPNARKAADAILDRLTSVNANQPIDFAKESKLVEAFGVAATQPERVMEVHRQSRNIDDVRTKLKRFGIELEDSEAAKLAERLGGDTAKLSAEKVKRAYEASQLEVNLQIDQAKAEQIVDLKDKFEKANTPSELAREAAIISVMRGVPEAQAVDVAKISIELNKHDHSAPKDRILELAAKIRSSQPNAEAAVKAAEAIAADAKRLVAERGLSPNAALDAAVLKAVDKVAEAKAIETAGELEKLRRAEAGLSMADGLRAVEKAMSLPALDKPTVERLKGALETALKANPADLRTAWSALREFTEAEWAKQGRGEGAWGTMHDELGKNFDEPKFREAFGLPATGNLTPAQISEAMLKVMAERAGLSPTLARGYAADAIAYVTPGAAPPAAPSMQMNDAQRRAMELAKSLKDGQSGLRLERPEQVRQLLKSTLDTIDEATTRWAEADRASFVDLIDKYSKGDAAAVRAVNVMLGLPVPAETAALPGSAGSGSAERPAPESVSLKDLQRQMQDPARRVEVVARLMERGPLRETLMKAGVPEDKARRLERELLSEREDVRRRAQREVARAYEGRGGLSGFGKECRGRLGAMVLVASALLPFIFSGNGSSDDGGEATWRGGLRQ